MTPKYILIHCADTPNGVSTWNAHDVDDWHRRDGCKRADERKGELRHIGYHFVIEVDGTVVCGRDEDEVGAHEQKRNRDSLGIALMGRDKFTEAQWDSLRSLVIMLCDKYRPMRVYGHRFFDKQKKCPGFDVGEWLNCGLASLDHHVCK